MHCDLRAGDPIEVGAASAVLKGGTADLCMTAAKSSMGHAEPAAGAIGILHVRMIQSLVLYDELSCRLELSTS